MEIIRFERIVSVTNEIQGHNAKNILQGEISPNKNWLCEKGSPKAAVILQLERAAILTSIHVGNAYSAFVEILVGKAADSSDHFESLVPASVFMSPQESASGENQNRTRFFNKSDFNQSAAGQAWDRIKVVCSQPFNKHVPYGLCFLQVQGEKEKINLPGVSKIEEKKDEELQIGSFFKKKRNSDGTKASILEKQETKDKDSALVKHQVEINASISKMKDKLEKGKKKLVVQPDEQKIVVPSPKKRKYEETSPKICKPKDQKVQVKRKQKKPFNKLMDDVVFVISGFQNPYRGDLRNLAFEMGARYSPDWGSTCTHLICACVNTPKFNQVKGKGKIVKKEWIEECHANRKRYPWRRFALDKKDAKKAESEEEIEEEKEEEEEEMFQMEIASPRSSKEVSPEKDKEDDAKEKPKSPKQKRIIDDEDYGSSTDEDEENKEEVDTTDYPMPFLPNLFSRKAFYVDPNINCKAAVERYIVAYNGILMDTFNDEIQFYVTEKGGAILDMIKKKSPNVVAVKPSWISEINSKQKLTSTTSHLVN